MGRSARDPDEGLRTPAYLPLLTSRRHIDLLRVCSASAAHSRPVRAPAAHGA
ncbi:hypothetical protein [Streptomyces nitrosporeus]|uniref:hypothetical protein n=1 Tax=Streptomyces nitrosporeus TaxID=28894 RepID=UPI00142E964F|nr:hypothetical protein [Streptomyces nitrosporeus]